MADFVSFNEFIDSTASAKVDYYRDTMARALSRPFRESAAFLDSVDAPVISDDTIEAEFAKMKEFVLSRYEGVTDVGSRQTFLDASGNFFDCIRHEQQPAYRAAKMAGYDVADEPPDPDLVTEPSQPDPKAFGPLTQPILPPLERGLKDPFGTPLFCPDDRVPLRRITIAQMARRGGFEDFFRKYPDAPPFAGTLNTTEIHHHAVCNETSGSNYVACSTWLNVWQIDPSPGVFSLSQLWLLGSAADGATQTIESGWQTFPALWGTAAPALFVYYNPHGYDAAGGYVTNSANLGFVLSPGSGWIVGGAMPQPYSVMNGAQHGNQMQWQIDSAGNWWLFLGPGGQPPTAVGSFPAGLYQNGTLAHSAQSLQFGGEVCSQNPGTSTYPQTGPMGSGIAPLPNPAVNFGRVAFQKQLYASSSIGSVMPPAKLQVLTDTKDAGYSATAVTASGSPEWDSYMFFGGSNSLWP